MHSRICASIALTVLVTGTLGACQEPNPVAGGPSTSGPTSTGSPTSPRTPTATPTKPGGPTGGPTATATGTAVPTPTGTVTGGDSGAPDVSGTWVLQQAMNSRQLDQLTPQIERALATAHVRGFSLRVPWSAISGGDLTILEKGRQIAQRNGVSYSIRFMAGRFSPASVSAAGPSYVVDGQRVPAPFTATGAPNTVFEKAYTAEVSRLAAWSRANGVGLLHLPWYGQDWAELNNGRQVRAVPGYSYRAWLNAHERLVDIAARYAGKGLAVEMPMSGYGPLVDASRDLTEHIVAEVGANSPYFYVQANGWGPNGEWGAPDSETEQSMDAAVWPQKVRRGVQAIQPADYDWTRLFALAERSGATYAEIYLQSFAATNANDAKLTAGIRAFSVTPG